MKTLVACTFLSENLPVCRANELCMQMRGCRQIPLVATKNMRRHSSHFFVTGDACFGILLATGTDALNIVAAIGLPPPFVYSDGACTAELGLGKFSCFASFQPLSTMLNCFPLF